MKSAYVLDIDGVIGEHVLRTGVVPNIDTLRMLDLMVELAGIAYHQGATGKPFNIGHGIPVKQKE